MLEKFNQGFTVFLTSALKVIMFILVCVSAGTIVVLEKGFDKNLLIVIGIYSISILAGYKIIKSKLEHKKKVLLILLLALVLRVLWLLNINSQPVSDFKTMYLAAESFLQGDRSMFWGTAYIARFPHLTVMVLYMALMIKIFPNPLIAMKFANLALGVLTVYLIYLIVKELFDNKKYGLYATLIAALFPAFLTYTAVFCTENIAMPFYLISIYIFLLVMKRKINSEYLLLAGVLLAFGNLFRMVATVVLIAFVLYILIYEKEKILIKIKKCIFIMVSYWIIIVSVSGILQGMKVTENSLWRGREPAITSILKGTHFESGGRWNIEDAALPEACNFDYYEIEKRSKEIILERLTSASPTDLTKFYIKKFALQWNLADLGGTFWSQLDVPAEDIIIEFSGNKKIVLQIFYTLILILVLIGVFNKNKIKQVREINFFFIMFGGYIMTYLITETQERYAYIACFVFVIMAIMGIDLILTKINVKKEKEVGGV